MRLFDRHFTRKSRPNREAWKPHSNAGNDDDVEAFEVAAKRLGIDIVVSYPVPGDNSDVCAGMGMRGIYIKRDQEGRASELQDMKWRVDKEMRS